MVIFIPRADSEFNYSPGLRQIHNKVRFASGETAKTDQLEEVRMKSIHCIKKVTSRRLFGLLMAGVMLMFVSGFGMADTVSRVGARIVWMDDPGEVFIHDTAGTRIRADLGLTVESGSTVQTGNSGAEIVLVPNGSVILLDNNTTFRIDTLHSTTKEQMSDENIFSLLKGKLRLIAAKITGSSYSVRTPTAVAGVRGTDFYRMYDPAAGKDWLCVTEGTVQFESPSGDRGVLVSAGLFVNLTNGFQTATPDNEWLLNNLTLETLHEAVPPPRN